MWCQLQQLSKLLRLLVVVICLKSCIFVVSITTAALSSAPCIRCDLLKKLYLCGVNYNSYSLIPMRYSVVICLKSCIFVVSITTKNQNGGYSWSCDLLKKLYLCGVNYNNKQQKELGDAVVICLKSCIFVVSITTTWKVVSVSTSCDLLKKLYLCGVNYNYNILKPIYLFVVICLKSCIFVVSITTCYK